MTEENGNSGSSPFDSLKRYVPPAVWTIALLTILMIPLKIIKYGYLPGDDALRHAAKAVSGKPWSEILVLNPTYKIDHEFGWSLLLEKIHLWTNWNAEALVVFSVVALFVIAGWPALACLRRPEAWLAALILSSQVFGLTQRLLDGRPFALTISAVTVILLLWQRRGPSPPKWGTFAWLTALIAFAVFFHDIWYLWTLLIAAFFLARQFRWCFTLAASWILGTLFGAALTGHPVEYILQAVQLALRAIGMHPTQNTLATELQPSNGNVFALILLGGLIVLRQLARLNATPLSRQPAFWLMALGWVLGCETSRFWDDWGAPALVVLMACDLQLFFQARFPADSFKRLALACGLALALYALTTNDAGSRWTRNLTQQYLTMAEHPDDLNGWLPGKGGIFYSADMTLFYQTFFKNPNAGWRYILGFEPTLMPDEDFKVYHSVLWNFGDAKAYKPWVEKMRPEDRLVIRGGREDAPGIPQLEWNYGVSGIWIGRLPRKNAPPPAPTVPATATMESPTNSVSLKNSTQ
jgi:hypothetical protein